MKTIVTSLLLFIGTLYQMHAQCNAGDFKALRGLYQSTNGANWTNSTGWNLVANSSTPPSGCDLSSMHGITLNANGRVEAILLGTNNLTGSINTSMSLLTELKSLNLKQNKLSGTIPNTLGDIATLEALQLQENDLGGTTGLTGSIPITGTNFPALRILRLNKNSLTGGIPVGLGQTTTIEEIGIHNNLLQGTLPSSLGELPKLTNLKLFNNNISGCFPSSYSALCLQLTNVNVDNGNSLDATWSSFCLNGSGECDEGSFITTWKTDNPGNSCASCIKIPIIGNGHTFDVDWENDGVYDQFGLTQSTVHDYVTPGTYTVAIKGTFPRIYFNNSLSNDKDKILSVDQWGDIEWSSMSRAFEGCTNLQILATDAPDLSSVTDLENMFSKSGMNQDISFWDVSNITSMVHLFSDNIHFNQKLDTWNVSNVENMEWMFTGATSFNQDLSSWSISKVTSMAWMFLDATSFNSSLAWSDMSSVTNLGSMFSQATSFNQDLSSWDVSKVTDMSVMFAEASSFNQDLSTWDVSKVEEMNQMFELATSFNGSVDWIDISSLTTANWMFADASSFNQDISTWDIDNISSMTGILSSSGLSVENYDKILMGWAAQSPRSGIDFLGHDLIYCSAAQARQTLINDYNWNINRDEQDSGTNSSNLGTSDWNDGSLWSLQRVPTTCNDVLLNQGSTITIQSGKAGYGASLEVTQNGVLDIRIGATLEINQTPQ